jgi:chromosome transmission fidelity protein 1
MERLKRELEADEREYEERLANARRKEAALRMAKGKAVKKQVRGQTSDTPYFSLNPS